MIAIAVLFYQNDVFRSPHSLTPDCTKVPSLACSCVDGAFDVQFDHGYWPITAKLSGDFVQRRIGKDGSAHWGDLELIEFDRFPLRTGLNPQTTSVPS